MRVGHWGSRRRGQLGLSRDRFRAQFGAEMLESRQLLSTAVPGTSTDLSAVTATPAWGWWGGGGGGGVTTVKSPVPGSVTPSMIETAYGLGSGNGAGETIAIVDAYNDPTITSDLKTFDTQYSLPNPVLSVVNETGGSSLPSTDTSWALEISLDVEWAHAIAPKANILLVEANSSSLTDLLKAVDTARNASGVTVVSMSWGTPESSLGSQVTSYDSHFTTPSGHANVTFVTSSGDDGGASGPSWPAVSPNVLSVGGTTLPLTSGGTLQTGQTETSWSDSGGGVSAYETAPAAQSAVTGTTKRSVPDVAYDANPNTGFAVYDSTADGRTAGWYEVGGTSTGAPQWAAIVANADSARTTSLSTAQTLTALYSAAKTSSYSTTFNDITSGRNSHSSAGTGYDLVTGLGSPKGSAVLSLLTGVTPATVVTHTATVAPALQPLVSKPSGTTSSAPGAPGSSANGLDVVIVAVRPNPTASNPNGQTTVFIVIPTGPTYTQTTTTTAQAVSNATSASSLSLVAQSSTPARPVQPLLSPSTNSGSANSWGFDLLDEAPSDSFDDAHPVVDPMARWSRSVDGLHLGLYPLSIWDEALASYGDDIIERFALASDTAPALPAVEMESDKTLEASLMAGAAVAVWVGWEARREKSDRRRRGFSLSN